MHKKTQHFQTLMLLIYFYFNGEQRYGLLFIKFGK